MLGKPVGDFSLPSTGNTTFKLSSTRGSKVVLYFYQYSKHFSPAHCRIHGISRDSLKSHQSFKARGIARSTFVVDEKRVLAREWRGVKVPGHIQEVLNFAQAL